MGGTESGSGGIGEDGQGKTSHRAASLAAQCSTLIQHPLCLSRSVSVCLCLRLRLRLSLSLSLSLSVSLPLSLSHTQHTTQILKQRGLGPSGLAPTSRVISNQMLWGVPDDVELADLDDLSGAERAAVHQRLCTGGSAPLVGFSEPLIHVRSLRPPAHFPTPPHHMFGLPHAQRVAPTWVSQTVLVHFHFRSLAHTLALLLYTPF